MSFVKGFSKFQPGTKALTCLSTPVPLSTSAKFVDTYWLLLSIGQSCAYSKRNSPQPDSKTFGIVETSGHFSSHTLYAASKRWHCVAEVSVLRTAVQRRGHGLDVVGTCAQIPPPESLPARTATSLWSRSEIVESNSRQERKFFRKENYWARCTKCFLSTTVSRLSQAQGFFQHFIQNVLIDIKRPKHKAVQTSGSPV